MSSQHASLLDRMEEIDQRLVADHDERQHFHGTYLRTTRSVMEDAAAGRFRDPEWTERWTLAFAQLYVDAFLAWEDGREPPAPWQVAFQAAQDPALPPIRHTLLGINAHINYDLPQALLAVISDADLRDDAVMSLRSADHVHVDSILVRRVPEEDKRMARIEDPGDRTVVDRMMSPFNRAGTRRFLKEARRKVWNNTHLLGAARRQGADAYSRELARLEDLSARQVAALMTSRFVIMRLAINGFGVELTPNKG